MFFWFLVAVAIVVGLTVLGAWIPYGRPRNRQQAEDGQPGSGLTVAATGASEGRTGERPGA